jgi:signal peptidase I
MNSGAKNDLWIEALKKSGTAMVTVAGGSMSPLLDIGDKVYVEFSRPASYRIGDTVVFPVPNSLMIHRIVGSFPTLKGKFFVHKGDKANIMAFGVIKQEQILGRAVKIKKGKEEIAAFSLLHLRAVRLLAPLYFLLAIGRYVIAGLKRLAFSGRLRQRGAYKRASTP